jgi:carboxyl-terminal processing protease
MKDNYLYVIAPIEDSPAYRAKIKAGDKIVEINHEPTVGLSLDEAVKKMKGTEGTKVQLGIIREGGDGVKQFSIVREKIHVKPVKAALVQDQYFYIRLSQFQKKSAEEIRSAIKSLKNKTPSPKGIILDLRGNPGGLLDEAIEVSSLFLKEGVVVSTEGRDPSKKESFSVTTKGEKELTVPLAVLINGSSASASEIVSGALQDHKRALILGSTSFGKGSVQTVAKVDEENGVKLTVAQYMTPSGKKIQGIGIIPDIELEDLDSGWIKSQLRKSSFLRESDLKNHLTATIETPEEKKIREEKEKLDRLKRIEEIQ